MIVHLIPSSLQWERGRTVSDRSVNNNARRTKKTRSSSRLGSKEPMERKIKKVKGIKQSQRSKASDRAPSQSSAERKNATRSTKEPKSSSKKTGILRGRSVHDETSRLGQRKASSTTVLPTPSTSPAPSDQTTAETEAKQHTFPKRDRTTSLMALQTLAGKIAQCEEREHLSSDVLIEL